MQARDPIPKFRSYMIDNSLMSEADIKALEAEVMEEVRNQWKIPMKHTEAFILVEAFNATKTTDCQDFQCKQNMS